jgi:tetratricopeptide (TPR) repeat protein
MAPSRQIASTPLRRHRAARRLGLLVAVLGTIAILVAPPTLRADTPLMLAAFKGDVPGVKALLDAGARVDGRAVQGSTPLMVAASGGHTEVVSLLLKRGARVDLRNDFGWTALMMAANGKHLKAVDVLMGHGADPDITNKDGKSALMYAEAKGVAGLRQRHLAYLLSRGDRQIHELKLTQPAGNNALATYRKVLELDPGNAKAIAGLMRIGDSYTRLAERELQRNDLEKSKAYISRGLEIVPQHIRLAELQAGIAAEEAATLKRVRELEQEREAMRIREAAGEYRQLAERQERSGNLAGSLESARKGLAMLPDDPGLIALVTRVEKRIEERRRISEEIRSHLARAEQQLEAGKLGHPATDSAVTSYRSVLELDPDNKDAAAGLIRVTDEYLRLAEQHKKGGDLEASLKVLSEALSVIADDDRLRASRDAARKALQAKRRADEHESEAHRLLAANELESSMAEIEKGMALVPDHAGLLALLPKVSVRLAKIEQHERRITKMLAEAKTRWSSSGLGHPGVDEVVAKYRTVLALDPDNAEALAGLDRVVVAYRTAASKSEQEGGVQGSLALMDEALVLFPGHAALVPTRQRLKVTLDSQQRALAEVTELLEEAARRYRVFDDANLSIETEVRLLERAAQRELETRWKPSSQPAKLGN